MQSIVNFNKVYGITDNELKCYSDETINIISDILEGNFESYNASQKYYGVIENYIGLYYTHVLKNYELAEKYYIQAINKGYKTSLNDLARLHYNHKNYELAEKYYIMMADKGCKYAFSNLASMYENQSKYELAEKYYLIAIDRGCKVAKNNLINMYMNQQKYDSAKNMLRW